MAYSRREYTGNGQTTTFSVPPYVEKSNITVKVDDANRNFTWTSSSLITITPAPALGAEVVISRNSRLASRLVDYTAGSSLTSSNLDKDGDQLLYLIQEAIDQFTGDEDASDIWAAINALALAENGGFCVNVMDYGASGLGVVDDSVAIQNALNTGFNVFMPKGVYKCANELLMVHHGQMLFGEGAGWGFYPPNNFLRRTVLLFCGDGEKYVKTRRLYRASALDPQDPPTAVAVNVQAEGAILSNFGIELNCDYTNTSADNYGDDWDVGLMESSSGLRTYNLHIRGYWRMACHLRDVTKSSLLPRFVSPGGTAYPDDATLKSGCDNSYHYNPFWVGGRWGSMHWGALGVTGAQYYDEILGDTVTDSRGSAGSSDFVVFGGAIHGPMHHSGYRWTDPLNPLDNVNEGLSSGALYYDAYAGIAAARITKQTYYATRFVSEEPYTVRLDRVGNIRFNDCHWEWADRSVKSTAGVTIDPSDTANHGYGTISATPNTGTVVLWAPSTNEPSDTWFWDVVGITGNAVKMLFGGDGGLNRIGKLYTLQWEKSIQLDGTDLDSLNTPGVYRVINVVNGPSGTTSVHLIVTGQDASNSLQIAYLSSGGSAAADKQYFRKQVSGAWRPWYRVLDTNTDLVSIPDTAIPSTLVWTGSSAPSGASSLRYSWQRIGMLVTAVFRCEYANAGSNLTELAIPFPPDLPTPMPITGMGSDELLVQGLGGLMTSFTGNPVTTRCFVRGDGAGGWNIHLIAAAGAFKGGFCTIVYMAD